MKLNIVLPFPPSVNCYWRAFNGRNILSKRGREYQKDAFGAIEMQRVAKVITEHPIAVDVGVTLAFYYPDRHRRDLDNYCKATLDALTKCGVWLDDSQVKALHLLHCGYNKGGLVEVEIETL